MSKAGRIKQLKQLVESLFEAAQHFKYMRLPELFCGFTKHENMGPVKYPIACDPQAWAAGSIFLFLRALLGIKCRGNEIHICDPHLPEFLQTLRLENIRIGNGLAGLEFTRRQNKTYCSVIETEGNIKVIFEKEV
jgi:glycogen debranching enzyme